MPLPNAVEQAEALADQLYQQAYGNGSAPEGGQPAAAPAPAAPAAPAPDTWEQKYRVLAGKYNAEVPSLSRKNKELEGQVATLSQQVAQITAKLEQTEANAKRQPLVKPEEVQEFGEPLVDLIRRAAREEAQALVPQANPQVETLATELKSIKEQGAKTAWDTFLTRLTELVPDWVQVNGDETFLSWLAEIDPLTGAERQTLLSDAQDRLDAVRVAQFFKTFKAQGATRAEAARVGLEQQAVPNTQSRAAAPTGKVVFTRREVQQFYADWKAGRISDAEAVAKEAEINKAAAEGRLR